MTDSLILQGRDKDLGALGGKTMVIDMLENIGRIRSMARESTFVLLMAVISRGNGRMENSME